MRPWLRTDPSLDAALGYTRASVARSVIACRVRTVVTHAAAERVEQRWGQLIGEGELEALLVGLIRLLTELRKP